MIATTPQKNGGDDGSSGSGSVGEYLKSYDLYKDELSDYVNVSEEEWARSRYSELNSTYAFARPPRIFLGIFTMDSPTELERRQRLRKTYLRAFKDRNSSATTTGLNRICSIPQLQLLQTEIADKSENNRLTCQLVYAFVVGGNNDPTAPTELIIPDPESDNILQDNNTETVVARNPTYLPDHDKGDILYLNIRENGKEGKTQTFFHYTVTTLRRSTSTTNSIGYPNGVYFDYLAKTDSDTLLFPEILLDQLLPRLPIFPHNMRTYVGHCRIKPSTPTLNLGPAYMGGKLVVWAMTILYWNRG